LRPFSARGWWLRKVLALRGHALMHLDRRGQADFALVNDTRDRAPLLMRDAPALHILSCVRAAAPLGGAMAEAGVFAGGSARLICEAKGAAALHLFDVFETLQRATEQAGDRAGREIIDHFGPLHGTRRQVEDLLRPYPNVHIHPGVFPASAAGLESVAFSFVHLDLDLGRSTREALEFFHPRMLAGGIVIGDDYNLAEVREAFEGYFAGRADVLVVLPWSQVMVVKLPD
jgi:hypothetical protein